MQSYAQASKPSLPMLAWIMLSLPAFCSCSMMQPTAPPAPLVEHQQAAFPAPSSLSPRQCLTTSVSTYRDLGQAYLDTLLCYQSSEEDKATALSEITKHNSSLPPATKAQ